MHCLYQNHTRFYLSSICDMKHIYVRTIDFFICFESGINETYKNIQFSKSNKCLH